MTAPTNPLVEDSVGFGLLERTVLDKGLEADLFERVVLDEGLKWMRAGWTSTVLVDLQEAAIVLQALRAEATS